ncbi:hypothetical protein R1flu_012598 [Riccia fluitans]|uniref:Uncharacterized protein n=1 Tax=Riccia fluitans TaxID=41844 RepID=A0ABD1ZB73_9MARC
MDNEQADKWRRNSQQRWIRVGDAPSKFFFTLLNAKHSNEEIGVLTTKDGNIVEEQSGIMAELHKYYTKLYKADPETSHTLQVRKEALEGITNKVTASQKAKLTAIPTKEEINKTIKELKTRMPRALMV